MAASSWSFPIIKKPIFNPHDSNFADETFSCCSCGWEAAGRLHDVLLVQVEAEGETSRVIVVNSPINIIYHLRSDPCARASIHHERANRRLSNDEILIAIMHSASMMASTRGMELKCATSVSLSLFSLVLNVSRQREVMNHSDSGALRSRRFHKGWEQQ